jgi:hypothetical protein
MFMEELIDPTVKRLVEVSGIDTGGRARRCIQFLPSTRRQRRRLSVGSIIDPVLSLPVSASPRGLG